MSRTPLSPYHRKLFVFLSVATFFEGFDQMALSQLLTELRDDFGLSEFGISAVVSVTNVGTVFAYALVRLADRWGRKPVLDLTIAGYTLFSFLCGLAPNAIVFSLLQCVARMFLIGEWVVSMIYAAEEYPADRRGTVIGVIAAFAALGAVVCAAIVPQLMRLPWGWRSVYFAGTVPLIALAFARRGIKETSRYLALTPEEREPRPIAAVLGTGYRPRILQMAVVWSCVFLCTQTAITFWKDHARRDLHIEDGTIGLMIGGAALVTMPMVFFAGRMVDAIGRKRSAVLVFVVTSVGCVMAYTLSSLPALFVAIALIIFGAAGMLPVLNSLSTELFPTHLRSDAFAWSNNLLGRIGFVLAPLAVGALAEQVGWAIAVSATALGPLVAAVLVWRWFPETAGLELERTAALH